MSPAPESQVLPIRGPASRRLHSWKEIAAHLGVSVRTVQRWERTLDLPVHRRAGEKRNAVYAYPSELDEWWNQRGDPPQAEEEPVADRAAFKAVAREPMDSSIAVLPFVNVNRDEEGEFFCDGITEDIINVLTKVDGLHVAPRSSVFQFKGKNPQIREVAEKLGVRSVLEGSVRRSSQRLRITAELVDVEKGHPVWSERYDRVMKDIFDIQDEISGAIVEGLKITLGREQKQSLLKHYTDNLEAYSLYLKGRFYWNQRTPQSIAKAKQYFQQALAEDPTYALAHAGVADYYAVTAAYGLYPPREVMPAAKAEALQALRLDDRLAEAHNSLAFVTAGYENNWRGAEKGFRHAIELNPNYATAYAWLSWFVLMPTGRLDEAALHARRASELDPITPIHNLATSMVFYFRRQYDKALTELQKSLDLEPSHPLTNWVLAQICIVREDYEEAIAACERVAAPYFVVGFLGYSYARLGKRDEARKLIARLKEAMRTVYVPAISIALIHLGLGERESIFECLDKAYEQKSPLMIWLDLDPLYEPIRNDARFTALLGKLRLGQAALHS